MFNRNFYPTPLNVIEQMLMGWDLQNKVILEPSAGSGNIVDCLQELGADVIACENDVKLKAIIKTKCKLIADDFFDLKSDQISHIHGIIMNPPFDRGAEHLLHAFNIAPSGCKIVCLLNSETLKNTYTQTRRELFSIVENYGNSVKLGDCFSDSERKTNVDVSMVTITKPGENYESEFSGFFLEEDEEERQENGIMSYNVVRDLVNRYVAAVKLYDEHLKVGAKMNDLLGNFYGRDLTFTCTEDGSTKLRNEFKKDLQKAGWGFIFNKMNLQKYMTKGVREDINKFVEQQQNIPFTMKNIYLMLDIVVQTAGQRMDKAILEVFDRVTEHHHDNRYNVKGWKTNSHFLVGKKFILPYMINPAKEYGFTSDTYNSLKNSYDGIIPDFEKALCHLTGTPFETETFSKERGVWEKVGINSVNRSINRNTYGEWYDSEFFKYKGYKNGNMHFEFKDENVWFKFNQHVAKLKGYPLFEGKEQTAYQKKQTGRSTKETTTENKKHNVLFEI